MIRPWVSTPLLVLVLISFVSAVDLERGRQARSHAPFAGLFKALPARLRSRDTYFDDYIVARQYDLAKRQNRSEVPTASSAATPDPSTPDTSADTPTPPQPEPGTNGPPTQPSTQSPEPTPTTQEPPPETTPSTPPSTPPPESSTTTSPTPPESSESSTPPKPSSSHPSPSPEPTTKPKPPPSTHTPSNTPPPKSSTKLIPTTNPDGSPSTITTVVVVQPTQTNSPGGNLPKPPGLQTGAAPRVAAGMQKGLLGVLGFSGVIAFAMAL
ncbi:hypothetical protein EMPG_16107 [Blastomyces silverae]|uniref:Uncharacterized protein n=1 Tax=Blastomyces silverae TaxID=2060906 RepID=A0A0H1BBH9_9EURO|nr:hypothetical protein EMPG_16107 [Blastomyces silverae]